jgi:hypothetical protein
MEKDFNSKANPPGGGTLQAVHEIPRRRAAKGAPFSQPEDEKPETHPAVRCSWKMRKRTGQR